MHPIEIALVISAVFVRETIYATAAAEAMTAHPFMLDTTGTSEGWRSQLEQSFAAHPRNHRSAKQLQGRQLTAEAAAVALWLMHKTLLWVEATWSRAPEAPTRLLRQQGPCDTLVTEAVTPDRLLALARCVAWNPDRISSREGLAAREDIGSQDDPVILRVKLLAYLLSLAGGMAFDPRMLPEIVVDHIGLTDSLDLATIRQTLQHCRWVGQGGGQVLEVACKHPAMDAAIREQVSALQEGLDRIFDIAKERDLLDLAHLPRRLADSGVKADEQGGKKAYTLPHVRFHLAQDEIRELLMGEQLYGDPRLAIR